MVIEYIGELIRNEVAEYREKLYDSQVCVCVCVCVCVSRKGDHLERPERHGRGNSTHISCSKMGVLQHCETRTTRFQANEDLSNMFGCPAEPRHVHVPHRRQRGDRRDDVRRPGALREPQLLPELHGRGGVDRRGEQDHHHRQAPRVPRGGGERRGRARAG